MPSFIDVLQGLIRIQAMCSVKGNQGQLQQEQWAIAARASFLLTRCSKRWRRPTAARKVYCIYIFFGINKNSHKLVGGRDTTSGVAEG